MINGGARLVIARSGIGKEIGGVESGAVPEFVEIAVKVVGARLCDVIDLRSAVATLIDRVGESIDGDFSDGVQAEDEIGREPAVEIGERVVGFETVDNVAVGERGQTVEFDIAVAVGAADEVVAAAGGVDESARSKLQGIGEIAARVGKILECWRAQIG